MKSILSENNLICEYYLDEGTASKYKIKNHVVSEEELIFDDLFENFDNDMDFVENAIYKNNLK